MILNNGSPKGFLKSSRGSRQGDPLSLFLYVLVAESLNMMLLLAESNNLIDSFGIEHSDMEISHPVHR